MADFYKDVRVILRQNGCSRHRHGKGSHEIWHSPITKRYFAVPRKIRSRHTANEILKQAGIKKVF